MIFTSALAEQLLSHTDDLAGALAYHPARRAVKTLSETDFIASCIARTSPKDVARLFATPAASAAEASVFGDLTPVIRQCVTTGQQARFNRAGLRAILTTAAYRIIEPNQPHATSSWVLQAE